MPAEKIHITLLFLGSIDDARREDAEAAAAGIRGAAIGMNMDSVGSFRKARVAWAAPSDRCAALETLQANLAGKLRAAGFVLEERAFNPHATLVRKIEKPVPAAPIEPVAWRSNALTLVRSEGDGRYTIVGSWNLG